jgi:hypothetical protein
MAADLLRRELGPCPQAGSAPVEKWDSPGQIRTAVARSLLDRCASIQSLESLARDRIAVTIGR